ncbi:MAG: helix-turn-helix domain-containing protein [Thermoproteota archaeon]
MVEEWVVIGPHEYLLEKADLEELEKKVYELLEKEGSLSLSRIWKSVSCHLWEVDTVLKRLRNKGLVIEEQQ